MVDTIKITELDPAGPLTGTEVLPIVQGGVTVKTNANDLAQQLATSVMDDVQEDIDGFLDDMSDQVDLAAAWAESLTAPGGVGTKSAKTHASEASAYAIAAASSATDADVAAALAEAVVQDISSVWRPISATLISGSASTNSTKVAVDVATVEQRVYQVRVYKHNSSALDLKVRRFHIDGGVPVQVPNDGEAGSVGNDVTVNMTGGPGIQTYACVLTVNVGEQLGFYGPANLYSTVAVTADGSGYYSGAGDLTTLTATIATTPQLQIGFDYHFTAVTGASYTNTLGRLTAAEVQTAKVPGLQTSLDSVPLINYWPFNSMDMPSGTTTDGGVYSSSYSSVSNTHRNEATIGAREGGVFFTQEATSASTLENRILVPLPVDENGAQVIADGDTIYAQVECITSKPGVSGALWDWIWTDSSNATVSSTAVQGYVATADGVRGRVLTSLAVPPYTIRPVGATRLYIRLRLNNPSGAGQFARWRIIALTRNVHDPATVARSKKVADYGPFTILVKRSSTIYVAPDGADTNWGDSFNPVATLARAVLGVQSQEMQGGHIHLMYTKTGGAANGIIYAPTAINTLMGLPYLNITADDNVVLNAGIELTGWTKTAGRTYIYEVPIAIPYFAELKYIFEDTQDTSLTIPLAERFPQMKRRPDTYWLNGTPIYIAGGVTLADQLTNMDAAPAGAPMFAYDSVAEKLYTVTSDRAAPGVRRFWLPQYRYFGNETNTYGAAGNTLLPGVFTVANFTLLYGDLMTTGQRTFVEDMRVIGALKDGIYPKGTLDVRRTEVAWCGNDGISPHGVNNNRGEDLFVHHNYDEGISDHYEENYSKYNSVLSCYNQSANYAPAYGARVDFTNCISLKGSRRQFETVARGGPAVPGLGDGGWASLGLSGDFNTVNCLGCRSIEDTIGFNDRCLDTTKSIFRVTQCIIERPTAPTGVQAYAFQRQSGAAGVIGHSNVFDKDGTTALEGVSTEQRNLVTLV